MTTPRKRSAAGIARQQEYTKEWQERNKGRIAERQREQRRALREAALTAYGGLPPACSCCGTMRLEHLVIDATTGDAKWSTSGYTGTSLYRRLARNNYPAGYRVFCWNCLMARSHNGACTCTTSGSEGGLYQSQRKEAGSAIDGSSRLQLAHG